MSPTHAKMPHWLSRLLSARSTQVSAAWPLFLTPSGGGAQSDYAASSSLQSRIEICPPELWPSSLSWRGPRPTRAGRPRRGSRKVAKQQILGWVARTTVWTASGASWRAWGSWRSIGMAVAKLSQMFAEATKGAAANKPANRRLVCFSGSTPPSSACGSVLARIEVGTARVLAAGQRQERKRDRRHDCRHKNPPRTLKRRGRLGAQIWPYTCRR